MTVVDCTNCKYFRPGVDDPSCEKGIKLRHYSGKGWLRACVFYSLKLEKSVESIGKRQA